MREHQIVITLKPEQFAQIQQMSKAAGAKTMGIFVRKTLLAALEIEGIKPTLGASASPAPIDDASLLVDLQRMHSELRDLISESLPSIEPESFDPIAGLIDDLDVVDEPYEAEAIGEDETDEIPLSKEERIASSIKVRDPLDELLDERLRTRLEMYLEHQKRGKPKVPTTRKEPKPEPVSQSISDPDETPKEEEEKAVKPKPTAPRSIPPDPQPREDKTGFAESSSPLSGNPPPKKPKY